ncbi:MAG TPA: HAMP domain-containing sensor histidine kinase, partial [Microbacteriaceae bacterium]|nr:HAMP domain-containing sensor histidine kinase [Microbacteriaceae bacterium]
ASDLAAIVAVALVCAIVVGVAGLLVLYLVRRSSLLTQLWVIVAAAMLSVIAGMIAVAQAMYLSAHDLVVTCYVAGVSAIVSLAVAAVLGRAFARNTARVQRLAQAVGDGETVEPDAARGDNSELAALASELALTSRKLAESREEVATLDASRRELVAWISHDLRTPLAGLRAMSEALEDGMVDDPARYYRQMRSQVEHLSGMVDDLFELSKIHSGTLSLKLEPVSLYDLVSDAVAELRALATSRSITLKESRSADLTVMGDARELARVIGNLLINAIAHSPAGSEIEIAARQDDRGNAVLSVVDAGGGIPEEDLQKIFQAGWRATSARTPEQIWGRSAGAGLGLAIVHGIVRAHEGDISVRNVPGGCRFDVSLPLGLGASLRARAERTG